jgi:hypothetical protein
VCVCEYIHMHNNACVRVLSLSTNRRTRARERETNAREIETCSCLMYSCRNRQHTSKVLQLRLVHTEAFGPPAWRGATECMSWVPAGSCSCIHTQNQRHCYHWHPISLLARRCLPPGPRLQIIVVGAWLWHLHSHTESAQSLQLASEFPT